MTVKEVLITARSIISDENNWTQGTFARDRTGYPVDPDRSVAVCFCSIGAVTRASINRISRPWCSTWDTIGEVVCCLRDNALDALDVELKDGLTLARFNDKATHQEVLALFDKAIANCQ